MVPNSKDTKRIKVKGSFPPAIPPAIHVLFVVGDALYMHTVQGCVGLSG